VEEAMVEWEGEGIRMAYWTEMSGWRCQVERTTCPDILGLLVVRGEEQEQEQGQQQEQEQRQKQSE